MEMDVNAKVIIDALTTKIEVLQNKGLEYAMALGEARANTDWFIKATHSWMRRYQVAAKELKALKGKPKSTT